MWKNSLELLLVHAQGEIGKVIVGGAPDIPGATILDISGTELRRRLAEGLEIPEWFSFPAVVAELRRTRPPRAAQGFTVFFTGFSGSGKSTIANALMVKLMEMGGRPVTLLDGDLVRKHLSSELGFSRNLVDTHAALSRIGIEAPTPQITPAQSRKAKKTGLPMPAMPGHEEELE